MQIGTPGFKVRLLNLANDQTVESAGQIIYTLQANHTNFTHPGHTSDKSNRVTTHHSVSKYSTILQEFSLRKLPFQMGIAHEFNEANQKM
jgi:hypothetical protein